MFWKNRNKERESTDGISSFALSPYSTLKPAGYQMPEQMLQEIEEEVRQITTDSISHHLIDEFTVEEMQEEAPDKAHFIDKIIHHKFIRPFNELKRQKIVMERETIGSIQMLQKAELHKQRMALAFARQELEQCEYILKSGNYSKAHIYNRMIGGKNYENYE